MNVTQHDEVMKTAHIIAYSRARDRGDDHFRAMIKARAEAKYLIDEAYDYLGFKMDDRDVRDEL